MTEEKIRVISPMKNIPARTIGIVETTTRLPSPMKSSLLPSLCVSAVLTLVAVSCGKKPADASQPLQQSFKTAEPKVRQAIEAVNAYLKAKDYAAAARTLTPVVVQQRLTQPEAQSRTPDIGGLRMSAFFLRTPPEWRSADATGSLERWFWSD
jgi:hypothetical protein